MKIIVNADDFGLSEDLNMCVEKLHKLHLISSASLISNSTCFDQAIKIAKKLPDLGIGVHLTLDGPFNVLKSPSSILDPETRQFYDVQTALSGLRNGRFKSEDIFREYCSQVERIYDNGIDITHIDHHHHLHLYYKSLEQVLRVAHKYKIKYIRSQVLLQPQNKSLIKYMYRRFHQLYVKSRRMITTNGYFELLQNVENSHSQNIERLKKVLNERTKSIEIETHPNSEQYYDTRFLEDKGFVEIIRKHQLISYKDLRLP